MRFAVFFVLLLASCAGGPGSPPARPLRDFRGIIHCHSKYSHDSKGTYEEALASGIAAFRSGEQPNILQVFDAGAATIINAKGAVIPAEDLIIKAGHNFDRNAFIDGVRYFYADSEGKFVGMPFNSSAPIMYINDEALKKAGVEAPKTFGELLELTLALRPRD